jgi:hypothetical protein
MPHAPVSDVTILTNGTTPRDMFFDIESVDVVAAQVGCVGVKEIVVEFRGIETKAMIGVKADYSIMDNPNDRVAIPCPPCCGGNG